MTFWQHLGSFRPAPRPFVYVCAVIAIMLTLFAKGSQGCFIQNQVYGRTSPAGDIILYIGQPLELFCTVDLEAARKINCTADNLVFFNDTKRVDARYQTRVNETTIRLYIENQTESETMFYCFLEQKQSGDSNQFNSLEVTTGATPQQREMVCMNWVAVGREPREVENYTCVSLNWQVLNCTWRVPKNYVKTTYKILYTPRHRYSERMACPTNDDENYNFCTWKLRSVPPYRKNFEELQIIINGTNKFKSVERTFIFNHYAHILMDPPKDLKKLTQNTSSITLQWDIGDLQYFPKPINYKILYKYDNNSEWDMTFCNKKNSTQKDGKVTCTVGGLICNKVYNFRVFAKSLLAADKYWSNYTSQLFTTSVSHPAHAPRTTIGSFQIESNNGVNSLLRTVFVYWQPLDISEQCGNEFHYEIIVYKVGENGREDPATDVKPMDEKQISGDSSYAKYEVGLSKYRFEIRAVNKEGVAPDASSVILPAASEEVHRCKSFTKTDYKRTNNCTNMYELSWQPPTGLAVDNYTIFWCHSGRERPHQCAGYLQWKSVSPNMSKEDICIDSNDIYQFAVSVNTRHSSSGMFWATCSVPHDHLGIVRQVDAAEIGLNYIEIKWKLECADQASTIKGYKVKYCIVAGPNMTDCLSEYPEIVLSNDTLLTNTNLTGLQPYTYYKVTMSMFNAKQDGQNSEPVILRTAEGAPNVEGVKLNLMNRTNTTITIGWESPRQMNGKLQHYWVTLLPHQQPDLQVKRPQATIPNLDPYTQYNVTVRACTVVCSPEIGPIEVSTDVGKPGKVEMITIEQEDQGTLVRWDPPSQLAGPHPFYEVHLLKDNVEKLVNRTKETQMLLPKPDCSAEHYAKYEVRVRAINVDDQAKMEGSTGAQFPLIYEGDKSPAYLVNCSDGMNMLWRILIWTTFPVLLMVLVGYGSRQLFYKCRQMKNVHVTIPMKFQVHPPESKGEDLFGPNYIQVVPPRHADEFSTLFDKTVEQSV